MTKVARKAVTFIKKFFKSLNLSTFNKICTAVQALLNHEEPTLYKLNLGASKNQQPCSRATGYARKALLK